MANHEFKSWAKKMRRWVDDLIEWQEENPEKNWLEELQTASTAGEGGGSNPPPPPPPPPGHGG